MRGALGIDVKRFAKFILATLGILIAMALVLAVFILWQAHSEHEFSSRDFESATGQQLPASASIIAGESLNWDLQGDHDACAVIEISPEDFQRLQGVIKPSKVSDPVPASISCSEEMNTLFANYKVLVAEYSSAEGGEGRYWALVDGKPIVLVRYASW